MKSYEFILKNLDCANCANKIQNTLDKNEELEDVVVNFNTLKLKYKTNSLTKEQVQSLIQKVEPEVELIDEFNNKEQKSIKDEILRLIIRNISCRYWIPNKRLNFTYFYNSFIYDFII